VQSIEQSGDGYLWIGTTGGLVRFDGSHFHLYDHATTPALADNSVFCTLAARDGSLWIGTDGGGLVHFKDGVFRAYSGATGLTNSFVRSLMEDDQGRIWIGTDNGLFQMIQGKLRQVSTAPYAPARFPAMIQPVVRALPLTAAIDALRGNMLQGMTLRHLTTQMAILLTWLVVAFAISLRIFRWR
jgi:hypothetical protein